MSIRYHLFICEEFYPEVVAAAKAEGWENLNIHAFSNRCHPPLNWDELVGPLSNSDLTQERWLLIGNTCIQELDLSRAPGGDAVRIVPLRRCLHLIAGSSLVDDLIEEGAYLMTPRWLSSWREQLAVLGFAPQQAHIFFQDCAKELVLLDTGIRPEIVRALDEIRAHSRLPVRRLAIGLDHLRLQLARWRLEWQLEYEQEWAKEQCRRKVQAIADHEIAMDLLSRLAKSTLEVEVVANIQELFHLLFAPEFVQYVPVIRGILQASRESAHRIPEATFASLPSEQEDWAWTSDGKGFWLRIHSEKETVGWILVSGLTFPQRRQEYLSMALLMNGVCGLAIENARNRNRLLESEKMASLGALVAGIAHEINTPVGIGLAAASTLANQTRSLQEAFSCRRMTRSDLETYLEQTHQAVCLIQRNLDRMGQLVDTFRQVAVERSSIPKERFRLRAHLDEVILSLGERLPRDRIQIQIQCDPALEIESNPNDWVTIFLNLIGNSLKHGFSDRDRGTIAIQIRKEDHFLRVDYRDDGRGMDAQTLDQIFEPFFSTDWQQGMGLGLHLVYNLVSHRLGGTIRCESMLGQGVHFQIQVPQP